VFSKRTNKIKIQMYHTSEVEDLESAPWERRAMLKPMTPPDWFKTMKSKVEGELENPMIKGISIRTCPSFINMLTTGYVIHNKIDTMVRKDDGVVGFGTFTDPEIKVLETHPPEQFTENFPFENGFCQFSLKFQSEWLLRSNVDVELLILPCWWDEVYKDVRAIHGMVKLPANFDWPPNINTFIRMPEEGEEYVIPANAPLAHIIPIDIPSVSVTHNQKLQGDTIAKKSIGTFLDAKNYSRFSDKAKNIGRKFRLNRKG